MSFDKKEFKRNLAGSVSYPPVYMVLIIYIFRFNRLTIKERNGGVGIRGKNRVVDESTSCVSNVNCKGFYDGETELL